MALPNSQRCVNEQSFSLHADVRLAIKQRHKREHLYRYITRPAIANERLTRNRAGQVVLTLKTPYRDGTTQIVMQPLEFMQRLAALVPRPRLHLIRFHGVLAPNAKLRPQIIPSAPVNANDKLPDHGDVHPPSVLTIIARTLDSTVIAKILTHLGLSAQAPPRRPARSSDLLATA